MADAKLTALTETSVPALDDPIYSVDVSDTTDDAAGSSRKLTLQRLLGMLHAVCQGRLTLETGVPVSTSDQTAKSTIYFTPYNGNRVALYDGTRWVLYTFTERSLALSGLTSGKNYDVFLYDNAGTLTLELSAAWTNDTTRADAISLQDGVYVKDGAATRRYLGTIRTTGTTTTEDSGAPAAGTTPKRFVWNLYNRVRRPMRAIEDTNSWTYTTGTFRAANADNTNRLEFVVGLPQVLVEAQAMSIASHSTASGVNLVSGIGLDSTSANHASVHAAAASGDISIPSFSLAQFRSVVELGYHYLQWLEYSDAASGTSTWYGDAGVAYLQAGITGSLEC